MDDHGAGAGRGAASVAIDRGAGGCPVAGVALAGQHAPDHDASAGDSLIIDLAATLVTAHSEKENAAPTFKRGFGFHPLSAFADHGP